MLDVKHNFIDEMTLKSSQKTMHLKFKTVIGNIYPFRLSKKVLM